MKITVWGINYTPELTGIAPYNQALCDYLIAAGHDVEMVAGFGYYPAWKKEPHDRGTLFRTEKIRGVTVHRCWQYVPQRPGALKRIFHELSFVMSSFARQIFQPRPDIIVVVSPPLLLGFAAWLLGCLKSVPFWFHVQDLQPDAAYALGLLKKGWLARVLYALESFAYRKAIRVSGISQGMLDAFAGKGVPLSKIVYFPNGVNLPDLTLPAKGKFRQRLGFANDVFLAIYSGNLGVKQGLEVIIQAAKLVCNGKIQFVICGDGARHDALQTLVNRLNLKNVLMLPLQAEGEFQEMLVDMDLAVITQESGTGQFFFPSKLLRTLAYGKPVLTVADASSELAKALHAGKFGVNVEPGDPAILAKTIGGLVGDARLPAMGESGKEFVRQFEFGRVLSDFESALRAAERASRNKIRAHAGVPAAEAEKSAASSSKAG